MVAALIGFSQQLGLRPTAESNIAVAIVVVVIIVVLVIAWVRRRRWRKLMGIESPERSRYERDPDAPPDPPLNYQRRSEGGGL